MQNNTGIRAWGWAILFNRVELFYLIIMYLIYFFTLQRPLGTPPYLGSENHGDNLEEKNKLFLSLTGAVPIYLNS